jgi:hypothetical protein
MLFLNDIYRAEFRKGRKRGSKNKRRKNTDRNLDNYSDILKASRLANRSIREAILWGRLFR